MNDTTKPVKIDDALMKRVVAEYGEVAYDLGYFLRNPKVIDFIVDLVTNTHGDPGMLDATVDVNDVDAVMEFMLQLDAYAGGVGEYVSVMYAHRLFTSD